MQDLLTQVQVQDFSELLRRGRVQHQSVQMAKLQCHLSGPRSSGDHNSLPKVHLKHLSRSWGAKPNYLHLALAFHLVPSLCCISLTCFLLRFPLVVSWMHVRKRGLLVLIRMAPFVA